MPPTTRAAGAPSLLAASGSNADQPVRPRKKARRGGGGGATARQQLLPSLAAFLLMDNNETHVEDVLVEEYVRRYMRWPEQEQERAAKQLAACMDAGHVVVVRAVMLATLEMDGWALPKVAAGGDDVVESSVPPSPDDAALPPGTIPLASPRYVPKPKPATVTTP